MNEMDYRDDYRENYRSNNRDYRDYDYRGDYIDYRNYRDDYRTRDYDRRGGRINNRNYRNHDFHSELEMVSEDMRDIYRNIEDISEMATNPQEKNTLMRVAQKEKENYNFIKQMMDK